MDVVAAADDVEDESELLGGPVGEVAGVTAVGPDPHQPLEVILGWGSRMRAASLSVVDADVTSTAKTKLLGFVHRGSDHADSSLYSIVRSYLVQSTVKDIAMAPAAGRSP
ncbi:hypothetical protein ABZ547_35040 [Streptomyces sparsogenes]|uniref:hypothetical protein n=1 Tax=Streptomyces sparsogenes TaxID=67365 RepID=UPI0033E5110D